MRKIILVIVVLKIYLPVFSQIDARLFRYPDISQTQITFVYGGDVWVAPKSGGAAIRLTTSKGEESFPRFSPDGKTIAFSGSYDGNVDAYTILSNGGIPNRITYNSMQDRVVDWNPDGSKILIASPRESGSQRFSQFYLVSKNGGLAEKLKIPYGELGSFSDDGGSIAYVTRITEDFPFKRYRGGFASDIIIYNLKNNTAENITKSPATEGKPAWHKNRIYFVSDMDKNRRRNIWFYDLATKSSKQITNFENEDINHMSYGPSDIVFVAGGKLYALSMEDHKYAEVKINVVTDQATLMPRMVNVSNNIQYAGISPDGKRTVFEARGELFSIPAENGYVLNVTNASGSFERSPAWSPNGKYVAYWSDKTGENEIWLKTMNGISQPQKLSSFGGGFGWSLMWSPDSKKIAFIDDKQAIKIISLPSGEVSVIDHTKQNTYSSLQGFKASWSPDSKWLAYSNAGDNNNEAIYLYSFDKKKVFQLTSDYYHNTNPVFDPKGKYLFFQTNRSFTPYYSSLDATWIYANTTQLAVASLDPSTSSLFYEKNDDVKKEEDKSADKTEGESKDQNKIVVTVIPENFEARMEVFPVVAGNYGTVYAIDGKLIYEKFPNTGAGGVGSSLYYYDLDKREEKLIIGNIFSSSVSYDGKSILIRDAQGFAIVKPNPDQKIEKRLRTAEMEMMLNPKQEWTQIFNDTWRRYRDFFYDPGMHQVNWNAMKKQYGALVNDAISRWDVNNILVELISELSAGHTYAGGGDVENVTNRASGFLGVDWALENGAYRIKKIIKPAPWDNEVRSPFDKTGINVHEGDYILSVNGNSIDPALDPYAAFEGLNGKTVSLKVSDKPVLENAREVIVKTLNAGQEARLRHLEWIEQNRKKVERLSNGQLGYMYMPNTAGPGQTELLRQFYAQTDKKGFVIDERFNSGGQLADRFLEMLNRTTLYYISWRNAKDAPWPVKANDAPKVMLINGWAGSGGDAFPWGFQQLNLGPIVGERTVGILVGPATGHTLIDGGFITVPNGRLYGNTGKWFAEGYGIKPDFEVWDDPAELAKGNDPQLLKAVEEALKLIKTKPKKIYPRPDFENRKAEGIKDGN